MRHCRRRAGIEPQPGIRHRGAALADKPRPVALPRDRKRGRPPGEAVDHVAEAAQRRRAIRPCPGQGLRRRAVAAGLIAVGHRRRGDLVAREIERDGLDDRGAGVDPDQDVGLAHQSLRRTRPPAAAFQAGLPAPASSVALAGRRQEGAPRYTTDITDVMYFFADAANYFMYPSKRQGMAVLDRPR